METATVIETPRLLLRRMTPADRPALCRILQDSEVMYAYNGPFSDEEVDEWLERQLTRYQQWGYGLWAVVLKATGEMIGQCGLTLQQWNGLEMLEAGYLFQRRLPLSTLPLASGLCHGSRPRLHGLRLRHPELPIGLLHHPGQ